MGLHVALSFSTPPHHLPPASPLCLPLTHLTQLHCCLCSGLFMDMTTICDPGFLRKDSFRSPPPPPPPPWDDSFLNQTPEQIWPGLPVLTFLRREYCLQMVLVSPGIWRSVPLAGIVRCSLMIYMFPSLSQPPLGKGWGHVTTFGPWTVASRSRMEKETSFLHLSLPSPW